MNSQISCEVDKFFDVYLPVNELCVSVLTLANREIHRVPFKLAEPPLAKRSRPKYLPDTASLLLSLMQCLVASALSFGERQCTYTMVSPGFILEARHAQSEASSVSASSTARR